MSELWEARLDASFRTKEREYNASDDFLRECL